MIFKNFPAEQLFRRFSFLYLGLTKKEFEYKIYMRTLAINKVYLRFVCYTF